MGDKEAKDMTTINKISRKLLKFLRGKYTQEIVYRVIEFDKERLKDYNGSMHWFLTCLLDTGKVPKGVIYIGTEKTEEIIEAYYDERIIKEEAIEKFLKENGITAEKISE